MLWKACTLSVGGARFDEMVTIQPTVGLYVRMPGLKKTDLQVDGRLCAYCGWSDPNEAEPHT